MPTTEIHISEELREAAARIIEEQKNDRDSAILEMSAYLESRLPSTRSSEKKTYLKHVEWLTASFYVREAYRNQNRRIVHETTKPDTTPWRNHGGGVSSRVSVPKHVGHSAVVDLRNRKAKDLEALAARYCIDLSNDESRYLIRVARKPELNIWMKREGNRAVGAKGRFLAAKYLFDAMGDDEQSTVEEKIGLENAIRLLSKGFDEAKREGVDGLLAS